MSYPMIKVVLTRCWQSKGKGTEQVAGTIPNRGRAHAVTLPGSVLQRLLVNVFFTPSRLGAFCTCPSFVLFWFLSAPVSYTGQYTDPVYSGEEFLGGGVGWGVSQQEAL